MVKSIFVKIKIDFIYLCLECKDYKYEEIY